MAARYANSVNSARKIPLCAARSSSLLTPCDGHAIRDASAARDEKSRLAISSDVVSLYAARRDLDVS